MMTSTMTIPLFSVVTVTFNHLNGLSKTCESLQNQTCLNHEWIVIDGGSQDGSQEYLDKMNAPYISEQDNGIYDAMNKGIDRCNGDYIIFMNAGDCFADAQILEQVEQTLETTSPDFIYGDALEYADRKTVYKKSRPHDKINQGMLTHHQAMLYRRDAISTERYDLSYKIAADYDFTLRLLKKTANALYIPTPICVFESGGLSQQHVLQGRQEQFQIRQKLGIPVWKNALIFTAQSALYQLRQTFPKLYWHLKRG